MTHDQFIRQYPYLLHIARDRSVLFRNFEQGFGLLSAAKLIDQATQDGNVRWRWKGERDWRTCSPEALKGMVRFRPWNCGYPCPQGKEQATAMHRHCLVELSGPDDTTITLGDNSPLGNTTAVEGCLADGMKASHWMNILNSMLYLFPATQCQVPTGADAFSACVTNIHPGSTREVWIETKFLGNALDRIRLCGIGGGGGTINGNVPRGKDTYLPISEWRIHGPEPKEVGIIDGIAREELQRAHVARTDEQIQNLMME